MRYFFEISYHGQFYHGWQNQANTIAVQQVVETVFTHLFRQPTSIVGSGRTDTGVHCRQQFFHADINDPFQPAEWLHRINSYLPRDIAIHSIRPVHPHAHARYSAISRSYEYHITHAKDPFLLGLAYLYFKPLDVDKMNRAASILLGEHDFSCFSKTRTQVKHFICQVKEAQWKQEGNRLVFCITANRFLRGMVRAIVGTLLNVGTSKITVADWETILNSKNRKQAGMNVPPHGLYLTQVVYPSHIYL